MATKSKYLKKEGLANSNSPKGIEGVAFSCINQAMKRINKKNYPHSIEIDMKENWEECLWLLTDCRDEYLPLVAHGNTEAFWKLIKDKVFQSKGYAVLKEKVLKELPRDEAIEIINRLAQNEIYLDLGEMA
jgi:hypothetical protein